METLHLCLVLLVDKTSYLEWSFGRYFTCLVYFQLHERGCHPHVTDKEPDARTGWAPYLRAGSLVRAPRSGLVTSFTRRASRKCLLKEAGSGLMEKGPQREPEQEHQGEMFATSSEAAKGPGLVQEKGDWRDESRTEAGAG